MAFNLKVIDHGWKKIRAVAKQMSQAHNYAKAGVLGGEHKERKAGTPITNVELAMIHEFGAPAAGIPERSFIRSSFELHRPEYVQMIIKLVPKVLAGKIDINKMLEFIGQRMAADMKKGITAGEGIPPPLKEATVKAKGSTRPLVDTGQLVTSITYAVVGKGSK